MNTIQKRIEEAARNEREQCREDNNEIWRGNPTYNDVEASFIKGAAFALRNQLISTSESMPPLEDVSSNGSIGVIARTKDGVIRYAYYHHYLKQWFSVETSTRIDNVTSWMFVSEEGEINYGNRNI